MAFLDPELLSALDAQDSWLSGPDAASVRTRTEVVLGLMPPSVREVVLEQLLPNADGARALVQALALASTTGSEPIEAMSDGRIAMRDHRGRRFAIAALAFSTPEHPNGEPKDVARLTELLDGTFHGRQYALYLRRPVPSGFDPGPVSRAVQLWLAAIDRGEWKGRHAVYEDDDIALELTLVKQHAAHQGGRVMTVGPVTALERLARVDGMVVDLAQRHREASPDLPLVIALGARPAWRIPRGYVEQLLYGTAVWTQAVSKGPDSTYSAAFTSNGRNLFSDPVCGALCALWWMEADGGDALGFRAWGHDNPWCEAPERIPSADMPRFVARGRPVDPDRPQQPCGPDDEPVLAWSRPPPRWRRG